MIDDYEKCCNTWCPVCELQRHVVYNKKNDGFYCDICKTVFYKFYNGELLNLGKLNSLFSIENIDKW
jgi:hypothetical protein